MSAMKRSGPAIVEGWIKAGAENLERFQVPGGWLYRTSSGYGVAMCFVPDTSPVTVAEPEPEPRRFASASRLAETERALRDQDHVWPNVCVADTKSPHGPD